MNLARPLALAAVTLALTASPALATDRTLAAFSAAHARTTIAFAECSTRTACLGSLTAGLSLSTRAASRSSSRIKAGLVGQACVPPGTRFVHAMRETIAAGRVYVNTPSPAVKRRLLVALLVLDGTMDGLARYC